MEKESKNMYVIGQLEEINVWFHEEQNPTEVVISFAPIHKDPNEGKIVYVNYENHTATYEDGTEYIPFHSDYKTAFIVTGVKDFDEFKENHGEIVLKRIKERLEVYNNRLELYDKNIQSDEILENDLELT